MLVISPVLVTAQEIDPPSHEATEDMVKRVFADTPVLIDIAECESGFHQFNDDGTVLHGGYKDHMIGIMQILRTHASEAEDLGFDINTREGNLGYAKWLYKKKGTQPWQCA